MGGGLEWLEAPLDRAGVRSLCQSSGRRLVVFERRIIDVTAFTDLHPGGPMFLRQSAGRDISNPFHHIGHSSYARKLLLSLCVGRLADEPAELAGAEGGEGAGEDADQEGKGAMQRRVVGGKSGTGDKGEGERGRLLAGLLERRAAEGGAEAEEQALIPLALVGEGGVGWHQRRRRAILRAHPEVARLIGGNPWTLLLGAVVSVLHAAFCVGAQLLPWYGVCVLAYALGSVCKMYQFMVGHELTHKLCGKWAARPAARLPLMLLANLPSFGSYVHMYVAQGHLAHHAGLGTEAGLFGMQLNHGSGGSNHPAKAGKGAGKAGKAAAVGEGEGGGEEGGEIEVVTVTIASGGGEVAAAGEVAAGKGSEGLREEDFVSISSFANYDGDFFTPNTIIRFMLRKMASALSHNPLCRFAIHSVGIVGFMLATVLSELSVLVSVLCSAAVFVFCPCAACVIRHLIKNTPPPPPATIQGGQGGRGETSVLPATAGKGRLDWELILSVLFQSLGWLTSVALLATLPAAHLDPTTAFWGLGPAAAGGAAVAFNGFKGVLYLILSELFYKGFLLHPFGAYFMSVHKSSEHQGASAPFADKLAAARGAAVAAQSCQPTMSTYSLLTSLSSGNLNYHVEHHDFPTIPWNRLPALKRAAPEFYDQLSYSKGYVNTICAFLTSGGGSGMHDFHYACQ